VTDFGFLRERRGDTQVSVGGLALSLDMDVCRNGVRLLGPDEGEVLGVHLEARAAELAGADGVTLLGFKNLGPLPADEGPHRVALRVPAVLQDSGERYMGDGIQEISVLPRGAVLLGQGVRVLRARSYRALRSVGCRFHPAVSPFKPVASAGILPEAGVTPLSDLGDWVIFEAGGTYYGIYWGSDPKGWCDPLGGEGLWPRIGDGRTAPFFHGWENYLRQWHGPAGWRARESAALVMEEDAAVLSWHHGSDLAAGPSLHFAGAVALAWGQSQDQVRAEMEAMASPLVPEVRGGALTGFDYLEGSYRLRRTAEKCRVTFPADPLGRGALVRVDGPPAAAVTCSADGEPLLPQLVSVGRVDDPYGPHEGRPDSGRRPVLARFEKAAERVECGVELSRAAPTAVEVGEGQGVSLSYLSQDDRRELLLFSHLDERPLGRLSLADLKLRDLRLPGRERTAAAILPLYWFLMNAPSRFFSANLLESWEVAANGPDELALEFVSVNPEGKVRSTVRVFVPAPEADLLRLHVSARLEILGQFDVPHFQFCNLFPEPGRMPDGWTHDETLARTPEKLWVVANGEARGEPSTVEGERFRDFRAPFFLSQYASPGGNFALLVRSAEPSGLQLGYELCRCWLDNHLFVSFPEGGPGVGGSYEVHYDLALWGDGAVKRGEVRELAEASLASGKLELR
jgi:hypothetical protein